MEARRWWAIVIGGLLGAVTLVLLLLNVQSPETPSASGSNPPAVAPSGPSAAPSGSAAPTTPSALATPPPPAPDRDAAVEGATVALTAFIRESQKMLAAPGELHPGLERYASGAALEEVQSQAGEFVDLQSRITGGSRVISVAAMAVDVDSAPASVTLSACLDDADIVLLSPEFPEGVSAGGRALNIYAVEWSSGAWRVVEHSYPDRTEC